MMVDDAHASGVFGRQGRGTVDHFGHARARRRAGGHAVEGARRARRLRRRIAVAHRVPVSRARPFLFSTSHPPSVAATCMAALDVLETEPQWMERLWDNTRFFKAGLEALGFDTGSSESPITPVIVGDGALAMTLVGSAVRGRRIRAGHRASHGARRARRGSARS